jgi:hypothetical protein
MFSLPTQKNLDKAPVGMYLNIQEGMMAGNVDPFFTGRRV